MKTYSIKIPCTVDLYSPKSKAALQRLINKYGKSNMANEVGTEVLCETECGQKFSVLQFNSSRRYVTISATEETL